VKTLSKFAVATAAVAAAVVVARRYDLANKGAALVERGAGTVAAGANWLTTTAVGIADRALTKYDNFVNEWVDSDQADDEGPDVPATDHEAAAMHQRGPGGTAATGYGEMR
jgi:hypothetical protein